MTNLPKNRRATSYDRGQHDIICEALKVSNDPNASGLTAYEAVCVTMWKLDVAREALNIIAQEGNIEAKGAIQFLNRNPEDFGTIKCY